MSIPQEKSIRTTKLSVQHQNRPNSLPNNEKQLLPLKMSKHEVPATGGGTQISCNPITNIHLQEVIFVQVYVEPNSGWQVTTAYGGQDPPEHHNNQNMGARSPCRRRGNTVPHPLGGIYFIRLCLFQVLLLIDYDTNDNCSKPICPVH